MIRHALATTLGLVLCSASLPAQDLPQAERYTLRVEYRWWGPTLTSEFQKGFGTQEGTLLDGREDFGLEDRRTNHIRGSLRLGSSVKLRGSWNRLEYDGDTPARQSFNYGGERYDAGTQVVTTIRGDVATGEIQWDFVKRAEGFLGFFVGAKYFALDAVVVAPAENKRVVQTGNIPVPVAGLAGRTYYDRVSVEIEVSGMEIGSRGRVWELDLGLRLHLSDRLAGVAAYRRLSLEGRDERDFLKIKQGGWSFGVELSL